MALADSSGRDADRRDRTLDSIRGVAALVVVIHHCFSSLPLEDQRWIAPFFAPARFVMLGKPAVVVFFVLSGTVLSFGFMGDSKPRFGAFLIRRLCRIYLPFAVSILLSAALYEWIRPGPIADVSPWFNEEIWFNAPTSGVLLGHLLMLNTPLYSTLNNAMWSLCIELRVSAVFPVLFSAMNLDQVRTATMLIGVCSLALYIELAQSWPRFPYFDVDLVTAILQIMYYAPAFLVGVLIARYRVEAADMLVSRSSLRSVFFLTGWLLLSQDHDLLNVLGAACLIMAASSSPGARSLLCTRPVLWIGRISYSLYLVHLIVIATLVHGLQDYFSSRTLILAAGFISLPVAQIFYQLVEAPTHRLARYVGSGRHAIS